MQTDSTLTTDNKPLSWSELPSGIVIMGKRQGTKKQNKQLWGRTAMAAALWYSAPQPKPHIMFVAADIHGPQRTPDAEMVRAMLTGQFNIPDDYLIMRQKTNCTLLEVRAVQAISRAYQMVDIFAVTHLYHAPRTQRYLDEVLLHAAVIPVHPDILDEITFPLEAMDLLDTLTQMVNTSLPGKADLVREHIIETILNGAHSLDPRGRFERRLARILRPGAYGR